MQYIVYKRNVTYIITLPKSVSSILRHASIGKISLKYLQENVKSVLFNSLFSQNVQKHELLPQLYLHTRHGY